MMDDMCRGMDRSTVSKADQTSRSTIHSSESDRRKHVTVEMEDAKGNITTVQHVVLE